jgi:protein TonB
VNADGSVEDVQVIRPVDPNLDKEAIRVLRKLPKFKPGEQRGKPVRVKYSVPVRFKLQQ